MTNYFFSGINFKYAHTKKKIIIIIHLMTLTNSVLMNQRISPEGVSKQKKP